MAFKPLILSGALVLLATACATTNMDTGDESGAGQAAQAAPKGESTTTCVAPETKCGSDCVDTKTSPDHCGACGSACASGTTCVAGFCSSEGSCAANRLACGSKCVDPQVDNENCGACGNSCGDAGACVKGGCPGELRVRAYIDGQSQLALSGATAKWHVVRAAAPGRWNGHKEATFLSGAVWMPVWPGNGENRDCNCDSQPSPPVPAPLKGVAQTVTLKKTSGRGNASITEQPTAANGFKVKVDFSDPDDGAGWTEIVLSYSAN